MAFAGVFAGDLFAFDPAGPRPAEVILLDLLKRGFKGLLVLGLREVGERLVSEIGQPHWGILRRR